MIKIEEEIIQTLKDIRFLLENSINKQEIIANKLDVLVTELTNSSDTIAEGVVKGVIGLLVLCIIIAILFSVLLGGYVRIA